MTPEFSRRVPLDRIGEREAVEVSAEAAERRAVAERLALPAIHALRCRFTLCREAEGRLLALGRLEARVAQVCVVSLEPFDGVVEEVFRVRFVPAGTERDALDLDGEDELAYCDGMIDLGEAATEQLALALDPFPRRPGADMGAAAAAERAGPFDALARLRPGLVAGEEE